MENYRLGKNISVYLDFLRTAAASFVFFGHVRTFLFPATGIALITGQAREAVAVFFVLSGFVISFVAHEKEADWRSYILARVARIYPVAILAMIVTAGADYITFSTMQTVVLGNNGAPLLAFREPIGIFNSLVNLTFTNQFWFSHVVFGSDEPYWSLGFEVWYYVFFGLLTFLDGWSRRLAILAWVAICGPKILLYLPLWSLGVFAYKSLATNRFRVTRAMAGAIFVATPVFYLLVWKLGRQHASNIFLTSSLGQELISFCYFTTIGAIVAANILAFDACFGARALWGKTFEKCVRWAAGGSFTLYLMHQPLLIMLMTLFPRTRESPLLGALAALATLVLVMGLAEIAERRKKTFAMAVQYLGGRRRVEARRA